MKLAILGTGNIAQIHASAYSKIPDVELAGMVGKNKEKAEKVAQQFNTEAFTDPYKVLGDESIEAIDVCYPTHIHEEYSVAALNRGKHVFCEIPVSHSLDNVDAMIKAAKVNNRILSVALLNRFVPEHVYVREAVASGKIGKPLSVSSCKIHPPYWPEVKPLSDTRLVEPLIIEVLHIDFELLNWIFGVPEVVNATGVVGATNTYEKVFASLEFDSVLGNVEGNISVPRGFPISNSVRLVGKSGMIQITTRILGGGPPEVRATLYKNNNAVEEIELEGKDPYEEECRYFVRCVKGEADPSFISAEAARDALRVSLATLESLKEEKKVAL